MSIEVEFLVILSARCPATYTTVAPSGAPVPRVVFQHIGGRTQRFLDNTPSDQRNILFQVAAWAKTQALAFDLIRAIEDDLCASAVLQATPQGEPIAGVSDIDEIRGAIQTFSIWGAR